jgi:hypothetical protein
MHLYYTIIILDIIVQWLLLESEASAHCEHSLQFVAPGSTSLFINSPWLWPIELKAYIFVEHAVNYTEWLQMMWAIT